MTAKRGVVISGAAIGDFAPPPPPADPARQPADHRPNRPSSRSDRQAAGCAEESAGGLAPPPGGPIDPRGRALSCGRADWVGERILTVRSIVARHLRSVRGSDDEHCIL